MFRVSRLVEKMIGLKKDTVEVLPHDPEWEREAKNTIAVLKKILGNSATDFEHVGSTAVPTIKAKPIVDIAVAATDFASVLEKQAELCAAGFYFRPKADIVEELLFACGSYYDGTGSMQTHFVHVVLKDSVKWRDYINFRNYLIKKPAVAKAYEALKVSLAKEQPNDCHRKHYLQGKKDFIAYTLRKALVDSYLGKTVRIEMDRPIGAVHPKHETIVYPINYGYIPGVFGGDGEELDVYLLGVDKPVTEYTARVIAVVHRRNDVEDKLVAAPEGKSYSAEEIRRAVAFQEQFYDSEIETVD